MKKYDEINSEILKLDRKLKAAKLTYDADKIREAREKQKKYKGYNRISLTLRSVKNQLRPINGRLRKLNTIKRVKGKLNAREKFQYDRLVKRKKRLVQKMIDIYLVSQYLQRAHLIIERAADLNMLEPFFL